MLLWLIFKVASLYFRCHVMLSCNSNSQESHTDPGYAWLLFPGLAPYRASGRPDLVVLPAQTRAVCRDVVITLATLRTATATADTKQ